jgi:hypothetical protein
MNMHPTVAISKLIAGVGLLAGVTCALAGAVPDTLPAFLDEDPGIPSPHRLPSGEVVMTVFMADGRFALIPATLTEGQRGVDVEDFPALARTGLHDEKELLGKTTITGRSLEEITALGRPGGLSTAGFMAADEEILAVLVADNRLVAKLGLTHPELATPLLHLVNVLDTDIGVVWTNHSWDGLAGFRYNGQRISLRGKGTKGGQKSIFDDGIEGAIDVDLWREPDEREIEFLRGKYRGLSGEEFTDLVHRLSHFHTGEMEPRYIMRYGFYEGHTAYRTDPIAIAFVFGLRSIEEIEAAAPGELYEILTGHFTRESHEPVE